MVPELFKIALLFIGIIIVFKLLFQFHTMRLIWDTVKIVPPVIGTAANKIAMSRFCRAMAVVYSAGMAADEAVNIASDATGNLAIARKLKYAIPAIQSGQGLTESLIRTGAIMPMVLDMLTTGEKAGSIDAVLQKVADYMDDETDSTLHKVGIALFILMILIAGIVVMKIVIDFYMKYVNGIANQVK
jgi:type II secretory pathway component PulF